MVPRLAPVAPFYGRSSMIEGGPGPSQV